MELSRSHTLSNTRFLTVFAVVFLAGSGFRPYQVEVIADAPEPAPEITSARYPGADAVVLEDRADVRPIDPARPEEGVSWTSSVRIKVLSPAGRAYGRVSIGASRDIELVSIAGRAYSDAAHVHALGAKPIAFYGDANPL